MPKVVKQSNRPAVRRGGIAGSIQAVSDMPQTGMRVALYGRGKTGKTTLACTWPKPLLILGTEDGTRSVRGVKGVDFLRLESGAQVDEAAEHVRENYKTVVLDTAGGLQDMIMKELLGLSDLPVEKSWGMAGRDQWQAGGVQCKERLRALLDLAAVGIHCVVIAHERNFSEEGNGSELLMPTVGPAMTPSVAGWLNGACDYLCQTFLREVTINKPVKVAGKEVSTIQRTGRTEYCLRIGSHSIYMTGFRRPYDPNNPLPDCVINPTYEKIVDLIGGGK